MKWNKLAFGLSWLISASLGGGCNDDSQSTSQNPSALATSHTPAVFTPGPATLMHDEELQRMKDAISAAKTRPALTAADLKAEMSRLGIQSK